MSRRTTFAATAVTAALLFTLTGCSFSLGAPSKPAQTKATATSESTEAPAEEPSDEPSSDVSATDDTQPVAGGGPVSAGSFQYDITSVSNIGNVARDQTATGTYLLMELSVKNTAAESLPFLDTYVKLVDAEGNTYDASVSATDSVTGDPSVWLDDIKAGDTVTNVLVYDVPEGTRILSVELTDNVTAETQTVTLN